MVFAKGQWQHAPWRYLGPKQPAAAYSTEVRQHALKAVLARTLEAIPETDTPGNQ